MQHFKYTDSGCFHTAQAIETISLSKNQSAVYLPKFLQRKNKQFLCFQSDYGFLIYLFLIKICLEAECAGRCVSSSGHSWSIRQGWGKAERVASSPLFKWISIMPPRLSRRPSVTPRLWLAHRRPTCSGQWKLLYQRPFTDNNEAV